MKLKKVKNTLRHDFDPLYIINLIKDDKIDGDDALRILVNACHVVGGLRCVIFGNIKDGERLVASGQSIWYQKP